MAGGLLGYHLQPFLSFFLFPARLLSRLLLRGRTAIFEKSFSATLDISTENSLVKEPSKSMKKVQLSQFKNRWAHRHPPSLPDAVLPIMMCTRRPPNCPISAENFEIEERLGHSSFHRPLGSTIHLGCAIIPKMGRKSSCKPGSWVIAAWLVC